MLVARALAEVSRDPGSVVTVGTFDGVHLGHAAILNRVIDRTRTSGARSVVVTFDPHPREIVGRGDVPYLTTLAERLQLLERFQIDLSVVIPFTYDFSRLTSEQFYRDVIIDKVGVAAVVVGHDHMFGRDREAGFDKLRNLGRQFGFETTSVDPVLVKGIVVNSSAIRRALLDGDVEAGTTLLGRMYGIRGTVVAGDGRGATLGFPTANILPHDAKKLVPGHGVYLVRVLVEHRQFYGMLNIGTRPTFKTGPERVIEVNVFEFEGNLYGGSIEVQFLKRLRPEMKFASKESLIDQIRKDREECLRYIAHMQFS
jgi:riboflavin kinase/FMN adenylyltransferase